jgi:glycerate-2-kinase
MATEVGDHPVPGPLSLASAEALASASAHVEPGDTAIVLLSGGASSLAAAPVPGITLDDLRALTSLLLSAGVDIATTNTIRKRFLRWGAGRLAAALSPARVVCLAISDVPGDDIASIGSGPCSGDALSATELTSRLVDLELWARMPASMRDQLGRVERGELAETPKPHDAALAGVETSVILDNGDALRAVVSHARLLGLPSVTLGQWPLGGEAADCGARVAAQLAEVAALPGSIRPACIIWGGETTVTLGPSTPSDALGGRSQELALGAARWLDRTGSRAAGLALLAAGTDGRDGPTDAAGAIVDASSWQMIRRAGRDPAADLRAHRAYQSLDAIDALLRPGLTGTNVMDVVIGVAVS